MKRLLLSSIILLALLQTPAHAAPGDLDLTFNGTGKVTTAIGSNHDYGQSMDVQSDGKILVAGYSWNGSNYDFAVVRYTSTGALDTTFNGTGKVTTAIGSGDDYGRSVAVQSDGKILVAGNFYDGSNSDFALMRYTSTGALDTTFNGTGKVTTAIGGSSDVGCSMAVQSDGKILVAGYSFNGSNSDFAVVRYTSTGALDTTFNGTGKVTTAIGSSDDYGLSMAVQSDGKILVAGYSFTGINNDIAVVRYTSTGALDTTFNGTGKVTTAIGSSEDLGTSVAVQSDGKILVAGESWNGSNADFAVVRYTGTGALDTTFNGTGKVTTAIGSSQDGGTSMAVQSNGKILVAGYSFAGSNNNIAVVRYTSTGALDTTFNGTGKVTTAVGSGGSGDVGRSMAVQSDGKILVAGYSSNGGSDDFALVRYEGAPTPTVTNLTAAQGPGGSNLGITGQVDPAGLSTTVSVEYGTTNALGSTESVGTFTGSGPQNFSATLYPVGLTWGTTYYYRVVATNANGTTTTAIQTVVYTAGARDLTFGGGDGIQITPIAGEESGQSVVVQADGKTVVVGYSRNGATDDITVVRYNTDGTLDTSFSGDGIATVDFGGNDFGYAVAVQSDGKIVVAGETPQSGAVFAIARLHGDAATGAPGTLDTSFDGDGKVTTDFNLNDVPSTIAIQPDGKILVGGYSLIGSTADFAIARYNADGSLDTAGFGTAGTGGKVTTAIGSGDDYGNLALQADGKIIMAGRSVVGGANDFSVARYNSNGTLDTSFDGDGKTTTAIGSGDDGGSRVLCQPDGKIVLGGYSQNGSNYDFAMVRYLSTGALDGTFGSGGKVTAAIGSGNDLARNIALQSDGRLVLAGDVHNGSNNDFGVARFNPDGTLDTTFDVDGKTTLAIGSGDDVVRGLALQSDGGIVVCGRTHNGTDNDIAVVRYLAGPMPLLVNGGFESNEALGGWLPTGFGDWGEDQASTVTAENGIVPYEGARMLKFVGTTPAGPGAVDSDVSQWVNLSAYASQIALGNVSVTVTSRVNRVAGNANSDNQFGILLTSFNGTFASRTATASNLVVQTSDGNPAVWELVTNTLVLPVDTTHLYVGLFARENVLNNTTAPEFDGHYADDVTLSVTVRSDIQLEQPVGTILVDDSSTVAFGTTPLGTPVTRTFRVTNTGGSPLNVTSLTLPPVYEHVDTFAPFILAPNATQDLTVRFLANTVTGTFNGTLTLTSDDADAEGSFTVGLTATATPGGNPSVTTTAATNVGTTTATLNGTVNPNGVITSAWFEWGETTSYGITTGANAVGYGTTVVFKSENISGLIPGRTIHYRLVAQNGEVTVYGADMSFTTVDNVVPGGGLMTLSPGSPFDPSTSLTVGFTGWLDESLPLTYMVLIDNIVVSPRGSGASRNFAGPTTPGTYTLKGRIYDAFDNMAEVTQSFTVNTPAESWRLRYFGTTGNTGNAANSADPDGDGLNNLQELAFGTDPTTSNNGVIVVSGGVIVQHGSPTVRVQNITNSVDFRALFGRRKDHATAGLTYTVQFSADLTTWQSSVVTPTVIADDGEIEACTVPYPFFINGKKARFFRVVVTGP